MRRVVAAVAVVLLGIGGWAAFGWFEVQKLWDDDRVNEAAPVVADGPTATGTFVDRSHPTRGRAVVLAEEDGRRVLRFERFATDNGPDLNVYLSSAAPDAPAGALDDDIVDLGDLKGNIGDQNYEVPPEVDLDRYRTVVVWCVRFSVAFGTAGLTAAPPAP